MGSAEEGNRPRGEAVVRYPAKQPKGTVLVFSDYRHLNQAHAEVLRSHGYSVITAITYSDAVRVLEAEEDKSEIDAIVIASKVHGWHHREGEERPQGIPADSDRWQLDNIRYIVDLTERTQGKRPLVLVAQDLLDSGWYQITAEGLEELGVAYQVYDAGNPKTVLSALTQCE